jgi:cyclic pyranopterin phosphate synthase
MPREGVRLIRHEDMLSFEEIVEVARTAAGLGVKKLRVTGGEPLVRRGIITLVEMLARVEGITDYAMTTNGCQLAEYAVSLRRAGLRRLNISLDTLDPARYAEITRGGNIRDVLAGIDAAQAAGFDPIKINCVVRQSADEEDAAAVAEFARVSGLRVRFIRRMNLERGTFSTVIGGTGGDCPRCNRLRLSCDGWVRPCLFNDLGFRVRDLGAREAILRAVDAKPRCGQTSQNHFYSIGG